MNNRRHNARSRPRHGVLLVEMLVTIGLMGIFLLVAGKLFTTTLRLTHASHTAVGTVSTFESCVRSLRRDVWSAAEVTSGAGGGVRITQGDGAIISWSAAEDGALVRQLEHPVAGSVEAANPESARRWPGLGTEMSLKAGGGGLLVRWGDDEIQMVSQVVMGSRRNL